MHLLVVDDDVVFRDEFSSFLGDEGHTVEAVGSVGKALEALEGEEFDLVFTDLKMPRQSGLDLLRAIRERWPRQYVIVVTGYGTVSTAVEAMKLGAFDYIAKPFRTDQVRKVLDLAAEQLRYAGPRFTAGQPLEIVRELAIDEKLPVLLAAPAPAPKGLPAGTVFLEFDGRNPARLRTQVEAFLEGRPRVGVVLAHAEHALTGHRTEDIVAWIAGLRELLKDRGVLAIGFDPSRLPAAQAEAITSALSTTVVHGTLEALSNPIRRRILRRLAEGPTSFSHLMRAADLDDSPKMSFHVHRLSEEGLIAHVDEEYQLTDSGQRAASALRGIEASLGGRSGSTLLFRPARGPPRAPAGG